MATGMVLTVAQTLLAALQCTELRDLCSTFGYVTQLEALEHTVTTIKAILLDAESKHQELSHEGRVWINKLKDAVYDADDLFDEFTTIAQRYKAMPGSKISKKVRRFLSSENKVLSAFTTSRKIKKLREKLDGIAKDRSQFGFSDGYKPVMKRKETYSYVREENIIGREEDKETILGMLLSNGNSSVDIQDNVSFVSIVGIGGLGKTALAQLVFIDDRIKSEFELKFWVCVSEEFGMKEVLSKILEGSEPNLEVLQKKVKQKIEGKRYLLVLDDVWEENPHEWLELKDFLFLGGRGSRIMVTSRSKKVARAIGSYPMHELPGLSDENSWCLFKKIAFEHKEEQANKDLVEIGKDIVKKCVNVPLSIRVTASLLFDQNKTTWLSFKSMDLAKMARPGEDVIMPTLMFSYYQLTPDLKSCFSFCSLFPKDYQIEKGNVISLWLAQGYLDPGHEGQSVEDVGEYNFSVLLHRCFFQDVKQDEDGEVLTFKMHDLIHDLAQQVAGKEVLMFTKSTSPLDTKIRHLSAVACTRSCQNYMFHQIHSRNEMKTMRTFLCRSNLEYFGNSFTSDNVDTIISRCKHLRVLELANNFNLKTIPNTIGKLLHLRYLNLSANKLQVLPDSITNLYNLQILKLCQCEHLRELPKDLRNLANLRHLDISGCMWLTHMPAGMDNLTCLHTLTNFVVGGENDKQVQKGQLIDLKTLVNLRGELFITVKDFSSNDSPTGTKGADILRKARLDSLKIYCYSWGQGHFHEILLEGLCPNHDLSKIEIDGYEGTTLPSWVLMMGTYLPQLVTIKLWGLRKLQHLSSLSELCHLKCLQLSFMNDLEYIEGPFMLASRSPELMTFFPSLEKLRLSYMPKLKGWWRDLVLVDADAATADSFIDGNGPREQVVIPSFPRLHELEIEDCPSMTYFPPCPLAKKVKLLRCNEALTFCMKEGVPSAVIIASSSSSSSNLLPISVSDTSNSGDPILFEELNIDDAGILNSLLQEFGRGAVQILIEKSQMDSFSVCKVGFRRYCASSLRHLSIYNCRNLESLSGGGIEHLTNLQDLYIDDCYLLDLEERENMPWKSLHSLSSLTLLNLPKLVNLPKGLQHVTTLQSLCIDSCKNLKALPQWLYSLCSLESLQLWRCSELKSLPEVLRQMNSLTEFKIYCCNRELSDRCEQPDGEDWPKIRHISQLDII